MKRVLTVLAALVVSVVLLAGCSSKGITVHVKLTGQNDVVLYDKDVQVTANPAFAIHATEAALKDGKVEYKSDNGFFTSFAGVDSTNTDGWLMLINDKMAQLGANEQPIAAGDKIEWKYLNYDKAFAQ